MLNRECLLGLAKEYGTPLFVYDGDMAVERYRDLYDFIPYKHLQVFYALKANYNPGLVRMLRDAGSGIDAVRPAEVEYAMRLGFPVDRIIYTANNMTDAEFRRVAQTGVVINIGSLSRLAKVARDYKGISICLRFNPDVCDGDSIHTMTGGDLTKFGILLDDVEEVKRLVREGELHVVGLHEHTGSGLQHAESVYQAMRNLMKIATVENFPELKFMDFGGGFKVPYRKDEAHIDYVAMGKKIAEIFEEFCRSYGRELAMYFEPGKYLSAECGFSLTYPSGDLQCVA